MRRHFPSIVTPVLLSIACDTSAPPAPPNAPKTATLAATSPPAAKTVAPPVAAPSVSAPKPAAPEVAAVTLLPQAKARVHGDVQVYSASIEPREKGGFELRGYLHEGGKAKVGDELQLLLPLGLPSRSVKVTGIERAHVLQFDGRTDVDLAPLADLVGISPVLLTAPADGAKLIPLPEGAKVEGLPADVTPNWAVDLDGDGTADVVDGRGPDMEDCSMEFRIGKTGKWGATERCHDE